MATKEETILAIKKSLRKANPDWNEEKVVSTAFAIFNSRQNKKPSKKEISHSFGLLVEAKEDAGVFYSTGYAATTDYDRVGDILTLDCLEDAATQINTLRNIDSDEVSYRHDRSDPKPVAIAEHNAKVVPLGDDRYGLLVTSNHIKTHPKYDEYAYDVANGVVKGYSIEYIPTDVLEDTRQFDDSGNLVGGYRIIDKMDLRGYGYAAGRMIANPEARLVDYGYKEIMGKALTPNTEAQSKITALANHLMQKYGYEPQEAMERAKAMFFGGKNKEIEMEEEDDEEEEEKCPKCGKKHDKEESCSSNMVEEVKMTEEQKVEVKQSEQPPVTEIKETTVIPEVKETVKTEVTVEQKQLDVEKLIVETKEAVLKELAQVEIKEKVMHKEAEVKMAEERIEIKELRNLIQSKELDLDVKFKQAGIIAEKLGILGKELATGSSRAESVQFKHFQTNGTKLEFKGLSITTNQNSDTDYLLSGAELRDVFDPMIYDALNQSTTTWALLRKDDFSSKGNNQVQFVLETGANATAAFYTGNAVATGQSTLFKYQTKFKKVQVGVAVDGDMIAAARGGPVGDVFGLHVRLATKTLLNVINSALFANVGLETAAAVIGFQYIADSAGNTTLYNVTRSAANKLSPAAAGDTYINGASARITVDNMRKAIEQAVKEGADINNLVFITHPTQERLFKGIYDASQRLMPTSSRFGFAGRPEFDAVPVFADKDCGSDDWFLIDLETHRVAIWVPPTLEMLGKSSDSVEGFIKSYLAVYNVAPRRLVMIYTNATS